MSRQSQPNPILPRQSLASATLGVVTIVMSFLASLSLGAMLLTDMATQKWLARATSAMTIQIIETQNLTPQQQISAVTKFLETENNVTSFEIIARDDLIGLLEPWLGTGNVSEDLPLPILIEMKPVANALFNEAEFNARLRAIAPGARLDTHGQWRETLQNTGQILQMFTIFILALVSFATATVILLAVRAGLVANQDILEILHQIGAKDHFISRRFETHFSKLAMINSFIGLILAIGVFYAISDFIIDTQFTEFLLYLLPVPVFIVLIIWYFTRRSVMRALKDMV